MKNISSRFVTIIFSLSLFMPTAATAAQSCFIMAQTYYEQLYCEIKAKLPSESLPHIIDFRKNEPLIQALLLKRPAQRLGVTMVMPKRVPSGNATQKNSSPHTALPSTLLPAALASSRTPIAAPNSSAMVDAITSMGQCRLHDSAIFCGKSIYRLAGNKHNSDLDENVFAESNKLQLPIFSGDVDNTVDVNHYLLKAYQQYLEKMQSIGLTGSTISYGKFAYFFDDYQQRGVIFHKHFEKVFSYIKQDKLSKAIDVSIAFDTSLTIDDCGWVNSDIVVCANRMKNFVFIK